MQKENITQPKPIDLGLPSGTLWADRNLGAESVTGYGDYYMWGCTEPCTSKVCDWEHDPFNGGFRGFNDDIFETVRIEEFPDGILSDQYDAAHMQLGGKWHMPTKDDFDELTANTTSEWVTNYQGSGIKGRTFTSISNGNSIFIPTSGYRHGSSVYYVGSYAGLWSSTLNSDYPYYAFGLRFYSGDCYVGRNNRCIGFCVRAVNS